MDRQKDGRTDGTDKVSTRFSQLLNEVPTIDIFKCELARYNSWGQPVLNVKEQADMEFSGRLRLKCEGTRAETRFRLSAKRTSRFKSAGASGQSTTGSRGVRISSSNAGYIMFRGCVKGTGYPLHSPVSPSLPLPCVTVCHHISTGLYHMLFLPCSPSSSKSTCSSIGLVLRPVTLCRR
jgi:hypothetical protein